MGSLDKSLPIIDANRQLLLTRVELIDHRTKPLGDPAFGRVFSAWDCTVELSVQDAGRTLKVFVTDL